MKTCDQYYQQIIQFDELSAAEKNHVQKHIQTCEDCHRRFHEINLINGALKDFQHRTHIDDEILTRFGIHISDPKHADYDGQKLSKPEIAKIQNHLNGCSKCKLKVDQIKEEFIEIESFLGNAGVPDEKFSRQKQRSNPVKNVSKSWSNVLNSIQEFLFPVHNRLVPAAVTTFAMLLIVVWFSPLFRGDAGSIRKLAVINKEQIQHVTRGLGSQLLNNGFAAFNKGDYKTTISCLEKFIQSDSVAELSAFIHKHLGLAYLLESEKGFLGRFQSFELDQVNKGINHLQKVLDLTENTRLKEDAYWYLGKAYLMKNEINPAKKSFKAVVELKGRKVEQAEIILGNLENK